MQWRTIRHYVLAALGIFGLSLSALLSAAENDSWSILEEHLNSSSQEISGLKGRLADLRSEKSQLFNETYSQASDDRAVAKEQHPAGRAQEAKLEDVNIEIRSTEAKIDRDLKKREFLLSVKHELKDSEALEKNISNVDRSIATIEKELNPIESKMHDLARTCRECKVILVSLDREPAGEQPQLREFRQLLRQRNLLEGHLDGYSLQMEALRDVKAYYNGAEAVRRPHRLNGTRPVELIK